MNGFSEKILGFLMEALTAAIGFVVFLFMLAPSYTLLKSGWSEGFGLISSLKVSAGGPLLIVAGIAWLILAIFLNYYFRVSQLSELITRFLLVLGWEFLSIPVAMLIYQISFGFSPQLFDFIIITVGGLLGVTILWMGWSRRKAQID